MEQLEERLTRIEREMEELRSVPAAFPENGRPQEEPWWERIAGDYAHDESFEEIIRLGAEWRREQREP